MKILPYLLLFFSLGILPAASDPDELVKLRKAWEKSLSDADRRAKDLHKSKTLAANKLYYEELQEMKKNFMTDQNLQAAIAVNKEIEKLVALHGKQEFEPPKAEKKLALEKKLAAAKNTSWQEFVRGVWILEHSKGRDIRVIKNGKLYRWKSESFLSGKSELTGGNDLRHDNGHLYIIPGGRRTPAGPGWDRLTINYDNPNVMELVSNVGWRATWYRCYISSP